MGKSLVKLLDSSRQNVGRSLTMESLVWLKHIECSIKRKLTSWYGENYVHSNVFVKQNLNISVRVDAWWWKRKKKRKERLYHKAYCSWMFIIKLYTILWYPLKQNAGKKMIEEFLPQINSTSEKKHRKESIASRSCIQNGRVKSKFTHLPNSKTASVSEIEKKLYRLKKNGG